MAIVSRPYSKSGAENHERIFGKRKKGKFTLDNQEGKMVKYAPRERKAYVGHPKEGVSNHVVPRTGEKIYYRGNMQDFKDEIQRAYDRHPDEAYHGKIHIDNP